MFGATMWQKAVTTNSNFSVQFYFFPKTDNNFLYENCLTSHKSHKVTSK